MIFFSRQEPKLARAPRPKAMTGRLVHTALFIGAPGTGKTTDLQEAVERNWQDGCRFVISDRLGYWGYMRTWPNVHIITSGNHEEAAAFAITKVPFSTVVIDEIAEAFPQGHMPKTESALSEIARAGRNPCANGKWRRIGPVAILGACQQPYQVDVQFRGLVDRFYLGRVEEKASVTWVKGIAEALGERSRTIPYGRFLVYDRM